MSEGYEQYKGLSSSDRTAQYDRLKEALRSHPGYVARRRWDEMGRVQRIWTVNTLELQSLLGLARDNEKLKMELIQNVRAPVVRDAFLAGLDQKLHNMLASAVSLVDHTRRLLLSYPDSGFAQEFDTRNGAVANAPGSAFLRRFRNYLLHVGNAPFNMSASFPTKDSDQETIKFDITLDSSALLEDSSFDWLAIARAFIADNPAGIPLAQVVDDYTAAMAALYEWAGEQFEVLHGAEIDEINDIVRRINLTMTDGAHDGRNMQAFWEHAAENHRRAERGEAQIDFQTSLPLEDQSDKPAKA